MKHSMKSSGGHSGGKGTLVSRHDVSSPASGGGNANKSDHKVANDGQGAGKGTQYAKHLVVNPSGNSGTVGSGQPLKSFGPKAYEPTIKSGAGTYKSTKPNK